MTTTTRPTGTVSFLFTDIEGSTPLWEQHPEAMRAALERHDVILREAIDAHGGFVFSTAGDAFSAAFGRAGVAVEAALDAQRALQAEPWPDQTPVRVRMGVYTGEAHERGGDYFGSAVNRAARLMGIAHGGQVLVSLAVEELVRDDLADGVGLKGLGERALKGLSRPESVFQLTGPDLPDVFPALAAATSVPGNLPSPPTSFVGRVDETKRLAAEIPAHRLVTLVGPGGVGKTRLSIEAAGAVVDEFPDGVWFVELAPVADTDAVVHAVASTLSVSPEAGSSLLESIVDSLAGRRVLVVVDNCEHVVEAAADIAAAVSTGAPKTTILATSREPLGVAGEQVWGVASLDATVEAVELFCERARSADHGFEPSDDDLELIGGICVRLDGMPLAIELAASRARSMSLAQLADRLADRFKLLRSTARGGTVERQATLRATVEWSYRLLGPDEQILFDRLSVFAGSFDLDAAEAVCGFDPIDKLDVVDLLGSLIDKSLVLVDRDAGRYRLLETLRRYGEDQLHAQGSMVTFRGRHARFFCDFAAALDQEIFGPAEPEIWVSLTADWDNLRTAFAWAVQTDDTDVAVELAISTYFFSLHAMRYELGDWAAQLLARPEVANRPDVGKLLGIRSWVAWSTGDLELGVGLFDQAVEDGQLDPVFFMTTIVAFLQLDDLARLRASGAQLLAASEQDDPRSTCCAALASVYVFRASRETDEALRWANRALAIATGAGSVSCAAHALLVRGMARRGDRAGVYADAQLALDTASKLRARNAITDGALLLLAAVSSRGGDLPDALRFCRAALTSAAGSHYLSSLAGSLENAAIALIRVGDPISAAWLLHCSRRHGYRLARRTEQLLSDALGPQTAPDAGVELLSMLQAAQLALDTIDQYLSAQTVLEAPTQDPVPIILRPHDRTGSEDDRP